MLCRTRLFLAIVLLAVAAPSVAVAQAAAGIILGQPTGLSFLFRERIAVGAAWSIYNRLHLHGDLWIGTGELAEPLDWFIGVGGKVKLDALDEDDTRVSLGARVPVGVRTFVLDQLEVFVEIAPGLQLFPETEPDIDAGLGVRYHF